MACFEGAYNGFLSASKKSGNPVQFSFFTQSRVPGRNKNNDMLDSLRPNYNKEPSDKAPTVKSTLYKNVGVLTA